MELCAFLQNMVEYGLDMGKVQIARDPDSWNVGVKASSFPKVISSLLGVDNWFEMYASRDRMITWNSVGYMRYFIRGARANDQVKHCWQNTIALQPHWFI